MERYHLFLHSLRSAIVMCRRYFLRAVDIQPVQGDMWRKKWATGCMWKSRTLPQTAETILADCRRRARYAQHKCSAVWCFRGLAHADGLRGNNGKLFHGNLGFLIATALAELYWAINQSGIKDIEDGYKAKKWVPFLQSKVGYEDYKPVKYGNFPYLWFGWARTKWFLLGNLYLD